MTEIETRNGRKFRIWHGRWKAVGEKTHVDMIMATVFQDYCTRSNECEGGAVPDRDYCFANLIGRKFGAKITLHRSPDRYFPPDPPGVIY